MRILQGNGVRIAIALALTAGLLHGQTGNQTRKKIVPIADLPGWSAWIMPVGSNKVEYRWRLFNADVKPGCGVEWRGKDAKAAYTIDAVIGDRGKASQAPVTGGQELLGAPAGGALAGQNAVSGDIPLHFALFGDGKTVSYYDLHRSSGCERMEIRIVSLEPGAR